MDDNTPDDALEAEVISSDELTEVLADATGTTPEEIEQGAENLNLAPPEEAEVVAVYEELQGAVEERAGERSELSKNGIN